MKSVDRDKPRERRCPDDGACHHKCTTGCFRVSFCLPFTDYGEDWTEEDKRANAESDGIL